MLSTMQAKDSPFVWIWKHFSQLSTEELYAIIALREEVFVVEQKLSYVDCDGFDQRAWHLMGQQDGKLIAYLRAFAPHDKYPQASFGRVLTHSSVRGEGLGKALTTQGLMRMEQQFGSVAIRISAQAYLEKFYQQFGFETHGHVYIEEGIPHLKMIRP